MKYSAGIDLGASKISSIVVSNKMEILGKCKLNTPYSDSFEKVAQAMGKCLEKALQQASFSLDLVEGLGIGVPGPVDSEGRVTVMPNLSLENVNVAEAMRSLLRIQVSVENDVNLATLAEFHMGAGKGLKSLYGIVPGTGVGGGYVAEGKIVKGRNNTAGEIGHMVVKIDGPLCGCGQRGCLEAFVSKRGFVRELREAAERGERSVLLKYSEDDFKEINSSTLKDAWEGGDSLTHQLLCEQARILGIAVANVVNLTGVEGIVIGGGLYEVLGGELLPIVKKTASQYAIGNGMSNTRLALSQLKEDAVALGAILLANQYKKQRLDSQV